MIHVAPPLITISWLILASPLCAAASAAPMKADVLVERCEGYLRLAAGDLSDDQYGRVPELGACVGYLQAVVDTTVPDSKTGKLPYCVSDTLTYLKLAEDFVTEARQHPKQLAELQAPDLVRFILGVLYSCK